MCHRWSEKPTVIRTNALHHCTMSRITHILRGTNAQSQSTAPLKGWGHVALNIGKQLKAGMLAAVAER